MITVVKDKNILTMYTGNREEPKKYTYKVDLNTGKVKEFKFSYFSDMFAHQTSCKGYKDFYVQVLAQLCKYSNAYGTVENPVIAFADKMYAIKDTISFLKDISIKEYIQGVGELFIYHNNLKEENKNIFKDLVAYCKDKELNTSFSNLIKDFIMSQKAKQFSKYMSYKPFWETYRRTRSYHIEESAFISYLSIMKNNPHIGMENLEYALRISLIQGLIYFRGDSYSCGNDIDEYIDTCKQLDKPLETGNFLMNYSKTKMEYMSRKDEIAMKKFLVSQNKYKYEVETDNYIIIVPKSREELDMWGKHFGNCLNRWEWEQHLSKGSRGVVIAKHKTDSKQDICLDFDINTLQINQFYFAHNYGVDTMDGKLFRDFYQKYLYSLVRNA